MTESKQYIIDNMTELENFLYLNAFKFVVISMSTLGVTIGVLKLLNYMEWVYSLLGGMIMLWVLYVIVWKQVNNRAMKLLEQGGFKTGVTYYDRLVDKFKK